MLFVPLFSGSSGNCTYVGSETEGVIIDCGVSATAALNQLNLSGISPQAVKAILVTHEHMDHIGGVGPLARKLGVPVYATKGTWEGMGRRVGKIDKANLREIETDMDFYVGKLNLRAFDTPHDCLEPCGYHISMGALRAAIATDMGYVKDSVIYEVSGCDIVLLEADYDEDMLLAGGYPYELKMRIKGRKGHLSNEDAGKAAVKLVNAGAKQIILGHLSQNNNFPDLALRTCENILNDNGILCGRDVALTVAKRDVLTGVFAINAQNGGVYYDAARR